MKQGKSSPRALSSELTASLEGPDPAQVPERHSAITGLRRGVDHLATDRTLWLLGIREGNPPSPGSASGSVRLSRLGLRLSLRAHQSRVHALIVAALVDAGMLSTVA